MTAVVVGLSVAAIVSTSGRTDATRRAIVAQLEDPAVRVVRVVDRTGHAGMTSDAVARVASLGAVEWAVGLTAAGPLARNSAAGDRRVGFVRAAVGARTYWGSLTGPLIRLASGRSPMVGEAIVGRAAQSELGLADGAGTVESDDHGRIAVVGTFAAGSVVGNLGAYVLIHGGGAEGHLAEVLILVRSSIQVEPLVARLPATLGAASPDAIGIDRAVQLTRLRSRLAAEAGALDSGILIGGLVTSSLLVGVLLHGAVDLRRREFGIRRTQGAQRITIWSLVVLEATLIAVFGAIVGSVAGSLAVIAQAGALPDPLLTLAIAVLVFLAALLGSMPAAASAAFGEPLHVLRSA